MPQVTKSRIVVIGAVLGAGGAMAAASAWWGWNESTAQSLPEMTATEVSSSAAEIAREKPPSRWSELEIELSEVAADLRRLSQRQSELMRVQQRIAESLESLETRFAEETSLFDQTRAPVQSTQQAADDPEIGGAASQAPAQEVLALLTSQLSMEGMDEAWSVQAMDQIARVTEQPENEGSTLGYVDCRATMCRVETYHRDGLAMDKYAQALPFALQWNSAMTMEVVDHPDGTKTSTLFISRDGYDLEY